MSSQPLVSFGICCWIGENSELPSLKRCLDSVIDYPVVLVNGKWVDIQGDYPVSTPKTLELINEYPNIKYIESPNQTEAYNRTIMFNECETEFMIYLDTDEWCEFDGNLDLSYIKKVSYVNYYDLGRGGLCKQIRIVRNPQRLKLKRHNEFMVNPEPAPDGLIIHSDRKYKSERRKNAMLKRNKENPIH